MKKVIEQLKKDPSQKEAKRRKTSRIQQVIYKTNNASIFRVQEWVERTNRQNQFWVDDHGDPILNDASLPPSAWKPWMSWYTWIEEDKITQTYYYGFDRHHRLFLLCKRYIEDVLVSRRYWLCPQILNLSSTLDLIEQNMLLLCNFNEDPGIIYYAYASSSMEQTLWKVFHFNELGELHREEGPAAQRFNREGVIEREHYIQHDIHFRPDNLPTILVYGPHGVEVQSFHTSHEVYPVIGSPLFWRIPLPATVKPIPPLTTSLTLKMCCICLEEEEEALVETDCHHGGHERCLIQWFTLHSSCPCCRKAF